MSAGSVRPAGPGALDVWVRRACALVVAGVAAYASDEHQRQFALDGGAAPTSARLWPLSVDGIVLLATVGLLRLDHRSASRTRWALWAAFGLGIAVSLAANIAAAPSLGWQPVLVAGWPPVALLLAVELLAHHRSPTPPAPAAESDQQAANVEFPPTLDLTGMAETGETGPDSGETTITLAARPDSDRKAPTAEEIMWAHYQRERAAGRTPTGAELDRVANTNNYGGGVLARWRRAGRLDELDRRAAASAESARPVAANAASR
jgi:hypothetical protein